MKKLIFVAAMAVMAQANALNLVGTVTEAFCGEMDPFVVGDACLVRVQTQDYKDAVVLLDFDNFQDIYSEEDQENMVGDVVVINGVDLAENQEEVAYAMDFLGDNITFYEGYSENISVLFDKK